ncbi:MAG: recombinase family protein [Bacteroidetes bacterium]|nr:recombinase family protein [Bacteroidota bacterium]
MKPLKSIGIWIRVSTEMQVESESPEHHEKRARLYAEAKGWEVIEVYRLEAVSGKSVIDHPEAKRMLQDVKQGKISALIFSKLARLARNTKELLEFADFFKQNNADLISLAESIDTSSPAGRLFYTMIAAMATWEREEIAERVAASVPIRAKLGKPLSAMTSLGYKWVNKEFVVDEKEAPVRKLIYEIFAKTKRKRSTAKQLNDMGYRTRNGSKFTHTSINRLLRDTTAKGIRIANYTTGKQNTAGNRYKPKTDWVYNPCPAIVSEELWNECNTILDQQAEASSKPGPRSIHLLSGFVYCNCGKKMYVYHRDKIPNFRCKECKAKIQVDDLDSIYHEQLRTFLYTDTDMASYNEKFSADIIEKEKLLSLTKSNYQKLRSRMDELVALRLDKEIGKESFAEQFKPLEVQKQQLETQLPELEAEIDFLKIEALSAETTLQEAKDLYSRWEKMDFEEKRSIVELITDRLIIDTQSIDIKLSYLPAVPSFPNAGKSEHKRHNSDRVW